MTPSQAPAGHALARTEERFKELVGTIDAIVTEYDLRSRRFTYVSEPAERILGLDRDVLEGEVDVLLSCIVPEDLEMIRSVTAKALKERTDYAYEYRVNAADAVSSGFASAPRSCSTRPVTPRSSAASRSTSPS